MYYVAKNKMFINPGVYSCFDDNNDIIYTLKVGKDIEKTELRSKYRRYDIQYIGTKHQGTFIFWFQQRIRLTSALDVLFCCPPISPDSILNIYIYKISESDDKWAIRIEDESDECLYILYKNE